MGRKTTLGAMWVLFVSLCALTACSGSSGTSTGDAGPGDAGHAGDGGGRDAGHRDAGATSDAGTPADAHLPPTDAHLPPTDAGAGDAMSGVDAAFPLPSDSAPACLSDPPPASHGDLTSGPGDPPPAAGAGVSFLTDWDANPDTGGWRYTQIIDSCRMHPDGMTWHGKTALRVEVDPGDDPLNLGSERAEALIMQQTDGTSINEGPSSGTVYYATSYFFPSDWDATFLGGDSESWSFVMQLYPLGGIAVGRSMAGAPQQIAFTAGDTPATFAGSGDLTLGAWMDLVIEVDWAGGHATIWRREQGETGFTQVVDVSMTVSRSDIYVKQGLYRGPDVSGRVDVFWIGPTARGTSFTAVEGAAFGTSVGPPT